MDPATQTPQQALSKYTPQVDASKYIRTYAKDVATLTNTPYIEPAAAPTSAPITSHSTNDTSTEVGVTVKEFDSSPVNSRDGVSPKEFEQEVMALADSDSDGIFGTSSDSLATSPSIPREVPAAPHAAAPLPSFSSASLTPSPNSIGTLTDAPEQTIADREAILARLRAKLASHTPETPKAPEPEPSPSPIQNPVPEPEPKREPPAKIPEPVIPPATPPVPIPSEPLIREAAPDFSTTPAPTLPSMPVLTPKTPVMPKRVPIELQTSSPLHTYSSDFADHIDEQKSSTFSVLAAQSDAGQTTVSASRPRRTFVPLAAGVAMLVIGIGAVAGAYILTHKGASSSPLGLNVPSLIRFDESVEVKGTGQDLMTAISNVSQGGSVSGNVVVTYVTGPDATSTTGIPQQGGVLIKALSLPAPDILLRNIDDSSTVGTIRAGTESRPFFILKVSSYERTFAGMLAWEQTLPQDLSILYPAYPSLPDTTASTTATSTPVRVVAPYTPVFTDGVVANYDVRILRDASGRSLMLYGYRGKDTLIIARDEAAFTALVSRLTTAGN